MRFLAWVSISIVLIALSAENTAHADSFGEVQIHILSSASKVALSGARVELVGSSFKSIYSFESDHDGAVSVQSLPAGIYRLEVRHEGYETFVDSIEVRSGQIADLDVALRPLNVIASVHSKKIRNAYVNIVTDHSTLRKFSPTLIDALQNVGGVQVAQVNGIGALFSIAGQDVSSTRYQINGVPLAGSGAALAVNTDLLAQAAIDEANDVVSFLYLSPTQNPTYVEQFSSGGFGSNFSKLTAQGTTGVTGFAFARTDRRQASLLNGKTYLDLSGQSYDHSGDAQTLGNYVKATGPIGSWVGAIQGDFSTSATSPIPTFFAGDLPAGYGPGERTNTVSSNVITSANGSLGIGGAGASISLSTFSVQSTDDARQRRIEGLSFPMLTDSQAIGNSLGAEVVSSTPFFSEQLAVEDQTSRQLSQTVLGSALPERDVFATTTYEGSVDLSHNRPRNGSDSFTIDVTRSDRGDLGLDIRSVLHRRPTIDDDLSISGAYGSRVVIPDAVAQTLADPKSADFDCVGQTISLQAPGDTVATPRSANLSVGWVHQLARTQVSVLGYANSVSHALLTNALVPAALEPGGFLSPTFVGQLQSAYHSSGGCGGPTPTADRIFFLQNVANISALYSGGTIDLSRTLNRSTTVELTYTYTGARITAEDRRLQGLFSPYVVGAQLPGVAPQSVTATVDMLLGRRGVEGLLNYRWTSADNARNLPPYGSYSFGLIRPVSRAISLSIVGTNLSNSYAGAFVSPRDAVNLPTISGVLFPTLASPLRPSTLFVEFTVKQSKDDDTN